MFLVNGPFLGKNLVSVPYSVYGGILANDDHAHEALVAKAGELGKEIGLTKARNATRRTDAKKLHEETGGFGYFPGSKRRVKKFSDVSDSEDDTDTELDLSDESELDKERRRVADEFGEVRTHHQSRLEIYQSTSPIFTTAHPAPTRSSSLNP